MKLRVALLAVVLLSPAIALAWTSASPFSAKIHNHDFNHVAVHDEACVVKTKLKFVAPEAQYQDDAAVRNYYRFKARTRFASGKKALSPVFFSQRPGTHEFEFSFDTATEGCWGKSEQKVIGVDVEGCRGRNCTVEPFAN